MPNRRLLLASLASLPLAARALEAAPPRFIVVLLRGAIDGLSVCAPYAETSYRDERPTIALAPPGSEGGLLDLDARFGLHPALAMLQPLWQAGQFGFVQACGQTSNSRSHFEAQDALEAGTPGAKSTADGWLSRLIGAQAEGGAVRALYSAPTRPKLLSGPGATAVAALPVANGVRATRPALSEGLQRLYAQDPQYAKVWAEAQRGREQVGQALQAGTMAPEMLEREMDAASNGAPPPGSFPDTARRLAQAMRADARLQIAALELGGWDTHARQGASQGQLAARLAPLGQGLLQLQRGLGPLWQHTVVTVISEFGRTVRENGNGGTDHGHGNALWLLGGQVAGGRVHGSWPGLDASARHEGRDLAVTTDYRAVMAGVAAQHLRLRDAALAQVFPGFAGKPLELLKA